MPLELRNYLNPTIQTLPEEIVSGYDLAAKERIARGNYDCTVKKNVQNVALSVSCCKGDASMMGRM